MFESKSGIFFIAGIGFFLLAFLGNGVVPMLMYKDRPEKTVEEVVNKRLLSQFTDLAERYPEPFKAAFGEASPEKCAEALRLGRQIYVGEGCWHCHSQFVRPVSNESRRYGPVAKSEEYDNELQRPVLFGTRRVGPDLSREGGRHGNDWHAVHFFKPTTVSNNSPMPEYPWFFDGAPDRPNRRGLALITYVQWLGSWLDEYPYYEELVEVKGD
ncbi:MAG: cbb3-type cytochrome c oxidase subunit II [Pirellulales bacterium]|jgi:cytochrome c oxidase cbb3-type subunit 2